MSFLSSPQNFYSGKHVLITGGSSGIGKELASILLSHGASVTLIARNEEQLASAAKELSSGIPGEMDNARVNVYSVDCSDAQQVERMADHVESHFGAVDILVNCCGNAIGGYFEQMDSSLFQTQMQSNFYSHAYPSHTFFKRMAERRSGHIIFVSSMAGQTGVFGQTAYCSSKYAVRGLAEALYFEGKPFNIDVTIVFPPDTDTPGLRNERATMPRETIDISDTGGLFSAKTVAKAIFNGIHKKRFRITIGFVGYLLGVLTAGLTPGVSFADVLLAPITRAITPFFLWDQNSIIRKAFKHRPHLQQGKQ